ncbi:hypothetical protein DF268_33660 [Streptomyces sp. V2]|uniref:Flp pilus assembly protein RcpC/CpaB domain-containing protein n=1 Tax=Streptomyces niveiscabiei TaxID=164115 RepID=A0ABW9HJ69_9ACTN|nr:hypothetical protein [Streptomyces sp. V2]PWG09243.1 hypothetical protein DF268_33660 [Streptomyces sp. V2]
MTVPPPSSSYSPPGADTPATCEVPHFSPVRVRGAGYLLGRLARQRGRALALGLAVTAVALVAAGASQDGGRGGGQDAAERARGRPRAAPPRAAAPPGWPVAVETVSAPVRIADAETVRLLRPGDRVDVIASAQTATDAGGARVVARGALVSKVPEPVGASAEGGALVVFSVPRKAAARLAGAGVAERLAVTLW